MSRYGDDQCAQCGGLRVAKSDMCVDCLVKLCEIRLKEIERLERVKIELHNKLQRALELNARLLDHISSEAIYTTELRIELLKVRRIVNGG